MASIQNSEPQNSEVVFDYIEPPQTFSEEIKEFVAERTKQLEKMNERWTSSFDPASIAAILRSHGFCEIEDINFQQIASRFGRAVQGLRPEMLAFMLSTLSAILRRHTLV